MFINKKKCLLIKMSNNIFCLLNCFNNYDIVAGKIIEFYIKNAVSSLNTSGNSIDIKTYFNHM